MVPVRARGWSLRRDDVIPGRWIVGAISTRVSSQRGIAVREVTADRAIFCPGTRAVLDFSSSTALVFRTSACARAVADAGGGAGARLAEVLSPATAEVGAHALREVIKFLLFVRQRRPRATTSFATRFSTPSDPPRSASQRR